MAGSGGPDRGGTAAEGHDANDYLTIVKIVRSLIGAASPIRTVAEAFQRVRYGMSSGFMLKS